jgi:hypothetical protein
MMGHPCGGSWWADFFPRSRNVTMVRYWNARGMNAAAATVCAFMGGEERHATALLVAAGEACL